MKREVEGSSPPLSCLTLFYLFHLSLYRVSSLVCLVLSLASPRSPCLPTTRDVPSSTEPDRAGQPGTTRDNQMSAKGNKAKASKTAPKDPTPKRAPSAGRLPARSPIDDGMRSQMFNLEPVLQYRRRDSSPLVPGLTMDPPRKKRKSRVSVENTPASAAD